MTQVLNGRGGFPWGLAPHRWVIVVPHSFPTSRWGAPLMLPYWAIEAEAGIEFFEYLRPPASEGRR